jgi:heat shock protein HslJ
VGPVRRSLLLPGLLALMAVSLVHTMKACSDPEGVMEQETAIYKALGSAARVEIAPGSLTILDDDGHIALTATS